MTAREWLADYLHRLATGSGRWHRMDDLERGLWLDCADGIIAELKART